MTKKELEKDVRTYLRQQFGLNSGGMVSCDLKKLLLGFAEPREKRIEELERKLEQTEKDLADYQFNYPKIKELEKENADLEETINKLCEQFALRYSLEDKIKELEQQMEKMKICQNCKFEDKDYMEKPCCDCIRLLGDINRKGNYSDKWELKNL